MFKLNLTLFFLADTTLDSKKLFLADKLKEEEIKTKSNVKKENIISKASTGKKASQPILLEFANIISALEVISYGKYLEFHNVRA